MGRSYQLQVYLVHGIRKKTTSPQSTLLHEIKAMQMARTKLTRTNLTRIG